MSEASPFNVRHFLNPLLMMACASGKHYPEARLVVRKAGGAVKFGWNNRQNVKA
jgi:type VI protein secretion system component Hcp